MIAHQTEEHQELLRLVQSDYDETAEFVRSVVSTSATIRGWAITLWIAIVGFAINGSLWALALLASFVVAVFAVVDAYHAWLYRHALAHAREGERIVGTYYSSITRGGDDSDALIDLEVDLFAYRFGLYNSFPRFSPRDLIRARPAVFFRAMYPALAGVAGVAAGVIAW